KPSTCDAFLRVPEGRTLPLSQVRVYPRTSPGAGPMASLDYAYRRLVNTLGPERVARSEFERMVYSHDFASLPKIALLQWKLYPDFVALPQTTEEVAALVKLSDESLLQITPRGGGTGWYGGSVPNRGGVLIDMRKMNHIVKFDPDGRTVTCSRPLRRRTRAASSRTSRRSSSARKERWASSRRRPSGSSRNRSRRRRSRTRSPRSRHRLDS